MPSAEAKLKKNRCANCFDCPSCCHTLSTRATSIGVPNPDDPAKTTPKKVYYLACGFCRWTSRDVGMKDQPVASGGWPEQENADTKRIGVLLDYYRQLAQREKAEKEKKKYIRRRSYLHFSDKYGLSSVAARRRTGMVGIGSLSLKDSEDIKIQDISAPETVDDFEELPDDYYEQPVTLAQVTTVAQRHGNPEFQPMATGELYPRHKHLLIKRSQRCKECEHNLSKPEFNPASIKFKIQLVALHHVPEIRIMSQPDFQPQKESQVILTMLNPLDSLTHVTLLPNDDPGNDWDTAKVELPACELVLSPRDDTAEFDDGSNQQHDFKDDPSVVVSRKANKIGFFIKVIPQLEKEPVKVSFILRYDYKNMTTSLQAESKEPETVWLQHAVYINVGQISTPQEE
jgi:dynactin-4